MKTFNKETSLFQAILEITALSGLTFHIGIIASKWVALPETIPVHFGVSGQPDLWGEKELMLLLPALSLLFYGGLTWLNRYPHKFNYLVSINEHNAERQYHLAQSLITAIKAQVMWLFAFITLQASRVALGETEELGFAFVPVVLVVSGATVVIYLIKASKDGETKMS